MRSSRLVILSIAVAIFASCQRHESMPTGSYGDRVVSGQVVMAGNVANSSPAGVEVSIVGTGMSATLGADGRFTFVGVPDNAQVTFIRADGISATVHASEASGLLQLGTTGLQKASEKHRGVSPSDPGPHQEIEGKITAVASDGSTITVHDSHGTDDKIALTPATLIRKGDKVVKATDLAIGDQVHVKATTVNNVLTASQVIVQDDDEHDNMMVAVGTVKSVSGGTLVVTTKNGDITVNTDANTVVERDGKKVAVSAIQTGDQVEAAGTRVDATTLLAKTIEAHSAAATPVMVEGTVKSVSGSSLVVTTKKGDVTLNTDANTVITRAGQKITVADIKTGDQVDAIGTRVDASTILAKGIEVHSAAGNLTEVEGTVKSVTGGTLVVTTEKGDITVNTDANTVVEKAGQKITVADIKTGDQIEAVGTSVDPTTILAKAIEVRASETGNPTQVEGTVKSVTGGTLVVTTEHGDMTVNTDANTVVEKDGQKITVADIKTGDQIEAVGTNVDPTTILARAIEVRSSTDGHH